MEILETPKTTPWIQRVLEWPIGSPIPVAKEAAGAVRAEISRAKKYHNPEMRFKTWTDNFKGQEVLMVLREN